MDLTHRPFLAMKRRGLPRPSSQIARFNPKVKYQDSQPNEDASRLIVDRLSNIFLGSEAVSFAPKPQRLRITMEPQQPFQYPGKDLEDMSFALNYHTRILREIEPFLGAVTAEVGAEAPISHGSC